MPKPCVKGRMGSDSLMFASFLSAAVPTFLLSGRRRNTRATYGEICKKEYLFGAPSATRICLQRLFRISDIVDKVRLCRPESSAGQIGGGMASGSRNITDDDIRSYYSNTSIDYWLAWLDGQNLSMHFGYEDDSTTDHSASLTKAIEVLADIAEIGPGDRVLDAGCGIGGSSLWLATARETDVVGIALGVDQVDLARREAKRRGRTNKAQFAVADFRALPFSDRSFDVVWAQESLCHADDKAKFFEEAARVLVPTGRIVVSDFMLRRPMANGENKRL